MLQRSTKMLRVGNNALAAYCLLALVPLLWPLSLYVGIFVAILLFKHRRRRGRLTTLGSARWAEEADLEEAGMLGARTGLILGRSPSKRGLLQRAFASDRLVRLPQAVHTAVYAPTGVGKGVSMVMPFLLTSEESCVVLDFKGELAKATAQHRAKAFKQRIVLIDPYRSVTNQPDTFNPLDSIAADHPLAIDDCNDLANALVVRTGRETEAHWNDSSEAIIAAVTATTVAYGEADTRSLATVREIISQPKHLNTAIQLMTESDRWSGALRPLAGQLSHFADKERASVISTALRHLRFIGTPAIGSNIVKSSFDMSRLRHDRMSIYLILPPDRASAQAGLLRMWVSSLLRACVREGM